MNSTKKFRHGVKKRRKDYSCIFAIAVLFAIWIAVLITAPTTVYATMTENKEYHTQTMPVDIDNILSEINSEMDISTTSGISKADFVYALKNCSDDKNNVLAENAEFIWTICQRYKINEFAFCGIISFESGWCNSRLSNNKKNIMSITDSNGEYINYESYEDCIRDGARLLRNNYINPDGNYATGGVLTDIAPIYLGDEEYSYEWAEGVAYRAQVCAEALTPYTYNQE